MNAHFPQSKEVEAEMLNHMMVDKIIMSAQKNHPIMGLVQDTLVAMFLLTQREMMIDDLVVDGIDDWRTVKPAEFFNLICLLDWKDPMAKLQDLWRRCKKYGVHPYSGRALFSALLPPDFYYRRRTDTCEEEPTVVIKEGVLIEGVMCKKTLGPSNGAIHHYIFREYGSRVCCDFLSESNFIGNYWLTHIYGLSVGIEDCIPEDVDELHEKLSEIVSKSKIEAINLGTTNYDLARRELEINSALNQALDKSFVVTQKHMLKKYTRSGTRKPIHEHNQLLLMPLSGSKGNMTNMCQIGAIIGSQNISGKRVPLSTGNFSRTLSCFPDSTSPESRGFVASNFFTGLSPTEFWFHGAGSREGLINTAITTSVTGYFHRKIAQSIEDDIVQYDGTVRDANGNVIEFVFGGGGLDPTQMISVGGTPSFADFKHTAEKLNSLVDLQVK